MIAKVLSCVNGLGDKDRGPALEEIVVVWTGHISGTS